MRRDTPIELNDDPEIGYGMLPAFQRCGYATEAVAALIAWIFSHPHVRSVNAQTFPHLERSLGVMVKNGLQFAGPGPGPEEGTVLLSKTAGVTGYSLRRAEACKWNSGNLLTLRSVQERALLPRQYNCRHDAHRGPASSIFLSPLIRLHSQQLSTRTWKGTLRNASGAPVKGAQIHLIGGHGEMVTETQADGSFQFANPPRGTINSRS